MKTILIAILLLATINKISGACTTANYATTATNFGCCGSGGTAVVKAPGVNACAATTAADDTDVATTNCNANYYLESTTVGCQACAAGYEAPAANTLSACTLCAQDKHSAAGTGCTAINAGVPAAGSALQINCRVFTDATAATCLIGKNGFTANGSAPCADNEWSMNGSACAPITTNPANTAAFYKCRSFSEAAATNCIVAEDGYQVEANAVVKCAQDEYSTAGGACTATSATAASAANLNCQSYKVADQSAANSCGAAKQGFVILAADSSIKPCVNGCAVCSDTTHASTPVADTCITPQAGWYIEAVTTAGVTVQTMKECSTDKLCKTCTWTAAVTGPPAVAAFVDCTAGVAGTLLTGTAATAPGRVASKCPVGFGSADGATAATCATACTAAKNCHECTTVDICTSCKAGYVYAAAPVAPATECTLFAGTKHVTCKTAQGPTDADCNECDAADFRTMELDAPVGTAAALPKRKGKCVPMSGYGEAAVVAQAAVACGENATKCTHAAAGTTNTECKTDHKLAPKDAMVGNKCLAKALTGQAGVFWDATTSTYPACHQTCATCTAASDAACVTCPVAGTSWAAMPSEGTTEWVAYLKQYWLNNSKCFDKCPADYAGNEEHTACVEGGAGGNSIILSITLVISIVISILF